MVHRVDAPQWQCFDFYTILGHPNIQKKYITKTFSKNILITNLGQSLSSFSTRYYEVSLQRSNVINGPETRLNNGERYLSGCLMLSESKIWNWQWFWSIKTRFVRCKMERIALLLVIYTECSRIYSEMSWNKYLYYIWDGKGKCVCVRRNKMQCIVNRNAFIKRTIQISISVEKIS